MSQQEAFLNPHLEQIKIRRNAVVIYGCMRLVISQFAVPNGVVSLFRGFDVVQN